MLKPHETVKIQISTQIPTTGENVATNINYFLRKMALKFQKPNFNMLC